MTTSEVLAIDETGGSSPEVGVETEPEGGALADRVTVTTEELTWGTGVPDGADTQVVSVTVTVMTETHKPKMQSY